MPDPTLNRVKTPGGATESIDGSDPARWAGEPLEGSGFEEEIPEADFEWKD